MLEPRVDWGRSVLEAPCVVNERPASASLFLVLQSLESSKNRLKFGLARKMRSCLFASIYICTLPDVYVCAISSDSNFRFLKALPANKNELTTYCALPCGSGSDPNATKYCNCSVVERAALLIVSTAEAAVVVACVFSWTLCRELNLGQLHLSETEKNR